MSVYAKHFSTKSTPQSEPIPGTNQVQNSAGGYSFAVDEWSKLDRWLVLGTEGGSYYATEKKLTVENAKGVQALLYKDHKRVVDRIVEISEKGRAPKNDPAIFALAMAAGTGTPHQKGYALSKLPNVCRIGTHLFQFAETVQNFRGWGRGLRNAIGKWYTSKEPKDLAYQVVKYQQRNGWSHRDLLRLSHPDPRANTSHVDVLAWAAGKLPNLLGVMGGEWDTVNPQSVLGPIVGFELAKKAENNREMAKLIRDYNLPRECVPTKFLTEAPVWEALLEKMPMTALIRNLATMTRVGLIAPMNDGTNKVLAELANGDKLKKSRVHPVQVLSALLTYKQGHGEKGKHTWTPVSQVVDALDGAFYKAFDNVEPTNKRWYLGVDVSESMWGGNIAGVPGLTPGMGAGCMALVTARTEPSWYMAAFNTSMVEFAPSPRQRLDDFCTTMSRLPWGGTDCAQPMLDAMNKKLKIDAFVVYTDSETWHNPNMHPVQALQQYRDKMGIPAKLIVVGMVANDFTIADPNDVGMMDCVGFDTNVPALMADFVRG